jgi:hypothetical protein
MDPFHEQLARVALDAAGSFGFALAGGYAVQAHGFLDRMSSDVDLFAEAGAEFDFSEAVNAVISAYRGEGFEVQAEVLTASFARLNVSSASDSTKVELGVDWRKNTPVSLEVGPVLHADDAVANKVCALSGRAEVRDYVDVDAIVASGRYTADELLDLAADHDPGFDRSWFAEALSAVDRLPDRLFQPYNLSPEATPDCAEAPRERARTTAAGRHLPRLSTAGCRTGTT